jgi:hypothetical protein
MFRTSRLQDPRNAEPRCADWFSRSRPRVSSKWTAPIVYGVFTIKKPDPLSSGFAIYRIPMCRWTLPFRDFSGALGFTPRVPSRWTVLVVSRFRDLRLQIPCQLRTPIAEMPTVSSMSATCPNKWTAVILSLFRESRFRDFRRGVSFVNKTSDIPNSEMPME